MLKDAHIHITRLPFFLKLLPILKNKGYSAVSIGCSTWEWPILEKIGNSYDHIHTSFGLHPYEITPDFNNDLKKVLFYIKNNVNSNVGEAGLDKRYPGYAPHEEQEIVFISQAKMALEYKRPLIIHCVGDYLRLFQILSSLGYPNPESPIHLHRFSPKKHLLSSILSFNCHISLHQDSFRGNDLALFLKNVPQHLFEFETDADETFVPPETLPEETANLLVSRLEKTIQLYKKELFTIQSE